MPVDRIGQKEMRLLGVSVPNGLQKKNFCLRRPHDLSISHAVLDHEIYLDGAWTKEKAFYCRNNLKETVDAFSEVKHFPRGKV